MRRTKTVALAAALSLGVAGAASAQEVKIGIFLGFTGPIESIVAKMGPSAELAIKEVNESRRHSWTGNHRRRRARATRLASTAPSATAAAERLITARTALRPRSSGATARASPRQTLQNVAMPNGVVMISPSATSPALSTIEDNGLFFRTSPSDARQGEIVTDILRGNRHRNESRSPTPTTTTARVLPTAIEAELQGRRRRRDDQRSRMKTARATTRLKSARWPRLAATVLVVAGYLDQGGRGIIQSLARHRRVRHLLPARRHGRSTALPKDDRRRSRTAPTARTRAPTAQAPVDLRRDGVGGRLRGGAVLGLKPMTPPH